MNNRRPASTAQLSISDLLSDIEKKEGAVSPEFVMVVLRLYRSLEATNRAQKEIIQRLGKELAALRRKKKG